MKTLILSCNTGGGHNSAAKSIKNYLISRDEQCDIMDALSFCPLNFSDIVSNGHIFIYRYLPELFGEIYKFEENHPPKGDNNSWIYDILKIGCRKLHKYLEENNYTNIICTHIFSAMMLTEIRFKYRYFIPTFLLVTDYTCSPGLIETNVEGYFIPHEDLKYDFVLSGLDTNKLIVSGIPVDSSFLSGIDKNEAKKALNLPTDKKVFLIMFGSMGCGPIKQIADSVSHSLDDSICTIIICGNNEKLYDSLIDYRGDNLKIVGFTDKVSMYMDAAELMFTKPGGLTTTEGCRKGLPMLFMNAVPGCETRNVEFYTRHNIALNCENYTEALQHANMLMNNEIFLNNMSKKALACFNGNPCEIIYNTLVEYNE